MVLVRQSYYSFWAPTIALTAFVALFVRRRTTYGNVRSATSEVALDAGLPLAYLGLALGAMSVVQGYKSGDGGTQLILPIGLGVVTCLLVWPILSGYRSARS